VTEREGTFVSDGVRIPVDCFEPGGSGPRPAIVALHGSGGYGGGGRARSLAGPVASLGYSVFLPHYFRRTGTERSDAATSHRHFLTWMGTVRDAIGFAARQPGVDPSHVGIIGISLGAYLGLAVASLDERVKAVVDFFGGMPDPLAAGCTRMPPTLILHGDSDTIVPVDEAHRLQRLLVSCGAPHEMKIYSGETHFFSSLAGLDAAQRTIAFLGKHLGS
jgi:carboxymethylenebutenolidase